MSNTEPFADIVVPVYQTEGLSDAVEAIRFALASSVRARDTLAAKSLRLLVEDLRALAL